MLQGVKSTLENLKEAFGGEHHEFTIMYPDFLVKSKEEKVGAATRSFHWANEVEKVHGDLYQEAIKIMESGGTVPKRIITFVKNAGTQLQTRLPRNALCVERKRKPFSRRIKTSHFLIGRRNSAGC